LAQLTVNLDGRGQLFCGRATDWLRDDLRVIFETIIAGNTASFFAAMARVYDGAGYHGHVDVGVAVTSIQGATSYHRSQSHYAGNFNYSTPAFTRTARLAAGELQEAEDVARTFLRHLYEATTGIDGFDPFS